MSEPAVVLPQFMHKGRLSLSFDGIDPVRSVYQAEIVRRTDELVLDDYIADKLPYYYVSPLQVAEKFKQGFFFSGIDNILKRLPTAESFRSSHFGEVLAAIYAKEVLELRHLYSKLATLTSENVNAYKMDLLFYRPGSDPVQFVFGEVKSSMKTADEGLPAGHDESCYSDLFKSLRKYKRKDLEFDLALIEEQLGEVPEDDAKRIRASLLPYGTRVIEYAGFCVIDSSTHTDDEAKVLARRKSPKVFDVELLAVAELPDIVDRVFATIDQVIER